MNLEKTYLTNHAIERLFERFPAYVKEQSLILVKGKIADTRKTSIWKKGFLPLLQGSTENGSLLNDSNFLLKFYEKYGFDNKLSFFDNKQKHIRFVVAEKDDGNFVVVTVVKLFVRKKKRLLKDKPQRIHNIRIIERNSLSIEPVLVKKVKPEFNHHLLWQNPGKVRDDNGYFLNDQEKMKKDGFEFPLKYSSLRKELIENLQIAKTGEVKFGEDGYFHYSKRVGDYLVNYKVVHQFKKSVSGFEIESLYRLEPA